MSRCAAPTSPLRRAFHQPNITVGKLSKEITSALCRWRAFCRDIGEIAITNDIVIPDAKHVTSYTGDMNKLPSAKRAEILGMMAVGVSLRAITRLTRVSKNALSPDAAAHPGDGRWRHGETLGIIRHGEGAGGLRSSPEPADIRMKVAIDPALLKTA
jgi:hypothetical protein